MNSVIRIQNLQFGYSGQPALFSGLDLNIPSGTAFGVLGPNGAGKSTLMKIILGLIPFKKGEVEVFEESLATLRSQILRKVGFLIEAPRLYPHLSGNDNLKLFATYHNIPYTRMPAVIAKVGMVDHVDKLVRHYSTGMKQRLAIAIALLHDPELLILDEPTNGLDPQGIVEIRNLIQDLNTNTNKTIIFCSHILSEVAQVCDSVGVLYGGKFVFQGSMNALDQVGHRYFVETDDLVRADQLLKTMNVEVVGQQPNGLNIYLDKRAEVNQVIDHLRENQLNLFQFKKMEDDLESLYLRLTR